jgi:hypothetical protein
MIHRTLSRVGIALLVLTSAGFAQNYFTENFNNNNAGWTLGSEWSIGPATASTGQVYNGPDPSYDASGVFGGGVAGVVIGGNASTTLHGFYYLTSPAINIAAVPTAFLNYGRWLNSDYTPYMQNSVDVWNGTSWVNLWITGGAPGVNDIQWNCFSFDVTAYKNAAFQVRFGFMIGSGGVFTVSSWNVDNVSIDGTAVSNCTPPPGPANDSCVNALTIVVGVAAPGTNVLSTTGPDPVSTCGGQAADVWYTFTTGCAGTYSVTTCQPGTAFDTVVAVWSGSCGSLVPVGCNDDDPTGCTLGQVFGLESRVTFTATAATTYYVSVGGYFGATGNFDILVTTAVAPTLSFISAGPGSIGYQIVGGPPNGATFTAVTLNAGNFPSGWLFGIDQPFVETMAEWNTGYPFIVGLDACGNATVGPFCCIASGINLYGVSIVLPFGGAGAVTTSTAVSGTVP